MNIWSEKTHSRSIYALGAGLAFVIAAASGAVFVHGKAPAHPVAPSKEKLVQNVGKLPLAFEPNKGQTDGRVKYVARAKSYTAFLTSNEAVLRMGGKQPTVVEMKLQNANAAPKTVAEDPQSGVSNYLIGNDRSKWVTGVAHYGKVRYQDVYPGIDLAYHGNDRNMEYDFVVKPGADPSSIRVAFSGQRNLTIDGAGNLVVDAGAGKSVNQKPLVYQTINGERKLVNGEYVLLSKNEVGFKLGAYDRAEAVVIDPVFSVYSWIGGSGDDRGWGVAANNSGVYLTGQTNSINFPTTPQNPASGSSATPIYQSAKSSGYDAFVTQMSADGTTLVWSTYLGGTGDDIGKGIAVDSNGNVYIAGYTSSTNLPKTTGAAFSGALDAFIAKLASNGQTLTYLEYFGGSGVTQAFAIALDATNDVYIGGSTTGGLSPVYSPYSSYSGNTDGFVAKFDPNGNLVADTYLGGSNADQVNGIAADNSGNVYVVGSTNSVGTASTLFPSPKSSNPAANLTGTQYAFYAEIKFDFSALLNSTVFGGGSNPTGNSNGLGDSANAVTVGASGTNASNGYVYIGGTAGSGFTLASLTPTNTAPASGSTGGFVAAFTQSGGTPKYLTFFPAGSPVTLINGIAADNDGNVYFAGQSGGNAAAWGRIAGPAYSTSGTLQVGGAILSQSSLHGNNTDILNSVSVNPQREAFFAGTTNSTGTSLTPGGSIAGQSVVFGPGYKTPYSSSISGGSGNSGANDVLFVGIQYQDLLLSTSPATAPPSVTFNATYQGSTPQNQNVVISVSNGASCTITPTLGGSSPGTFTVTQVDSTSTFIVGLSSSANTNAVGVQTATVSFAGSNCLPSGLASDNTPVLYLVYNVNTTLVVNAGGSTSVTVTQGKANSPSTVNMPFQVSTTGGSTTYSVALTSQTTPTNGTFPTIGTASNGPPNTNCLIVPAGGTATVAVQTYTMQVDTTCLSNLGTSLVAGTYTANISFSGPGLATVNIPFTLTVNAAGTAPGTVGVTNTSFSFQFASGSTFTQQQATTLSANGGTATYSASITALPSTSLSAGASNAPGGALTIVSGASGSLSSGATQDIVVQANPSGVANGLYQAYLTVVSNVAQNVSSSFCTSSAATTCNYLITLSIGNGISATPAFFSYSAPQGYPSSQLANGGNQTLTLSVFSYNSGSFTVPAPTISGLPSGSVTITPGTNTVSGGGCPSSGQFTTCTYTVTANTVNVLAGNYSGNITIAPSSSQSSLGLNTLTLPVTLSVSTQPSIVASNSGTTLVPVGASGVVLSMTKNSSGAISGGGVCSNGAVTSGNPTIYLATNGGSDTISSVSVSSVSTPTMNLVISPTATALANTSLTASSFVPVQLCANIISSSGNVPLGSFTASITLKDSFNATTTIPVTITVGSTSAGMIGIFRSNVPGSGGPAQFALDVNGDYRFESGIDKFRLFGLDGDYPVAGDWTGIGVVRIGVFRPGQGAWFLDLNNNGTWDGVSGGDGVFFFGLPGDIPVVGDWSGNGITKFGIFRCPSNGGVCTFVLDFAGKMAFDPTTAVFNSYGLAGDYPVANNWNGLNGGADQIGVFRCPAAGKPGVCTWYVNSTGTGYFNSGDQQFSYGLPGDIPEVGNWYGTGRKRIGVFRSGTWILNLSGSNVFDFSDQITNFGLPGDKPVVGNWSGPLATNP